MTEPIKNVSDLQIQEGVKNKATGEIYIVVRILPNGSRVAVHHAVITGDDLGNWEKYIGP